MTAQNYPCNNKPSARPGKPLNFRVQQVNPNYTVVAWEHAQNGAPVDIYQLNVISRTGPGVNFRLTVPNNYTSVAVPMFPNSVYELYLWASGYDGIPSELAGPRSIVTPPAINSQPPCNPPNPGCYPPPRPPYYPPNPGCCPPPRPPYNPPKPPYYPPNPGCCPPPRPPYNPPKPPYYPPNPGCSDHNGRGW